MTRIYPVKSDRARLDYSNAENIHPINLLYFTFTFNDVGKSKMLKKLPRNSMIYGVLSVRVEEGFDGGETQLRIGTSVDNNDIAIITVAPKGVTLDLWPGERENYLKLLKRGVELKMSLVNVTTPVPTLGVGWGILQWIDLNLVEGFR